MPAGTNPIYISRPKVGFSNVYTAGNTTKDLSSGTIPPPVFVANTSNGSFLDHVRAKPVGTNVASCARIFLNNGGSTTNAVNNSMITELSLPVTTITEIAAQPEIIVPLKLPIQAGYNVYIVLATAVAAGWEFTAVGGDY